MRPVALAFVVLLLVVWLVSWDLLLRPARGADLSVPIPRVQNEFTTRFGTWKRVIGPSGTSFWSPSVDFPRWTHSYPKR